MSDPSFETGDASPAVAAPDVARVLVDLGLPHLDRPFDYLVPPDLAGHAVPGVRVKVRFAGRMLDGFVIERVAGSDVARLTPLAKVVSDEVVLPAESIALIRAVADHYAGTFSDVARLAIPPRHATTEKAEPRPGAEPPEPDAGESPLAAYPAGAAYLDALVGGDAPRAAWAVVPVTDFAGDWAEGFASAAAATVASGRSAVLIVPDARDVDRLLPAVQRRVGKALVARQTADVGPAARYRAFLGGLRGQARVVVGTRAAVFAPVHDLGLVAIWDDGDDSHADPHAPYPHARDVAAIRVAQQGAALLVGGYAQTAEVAAWLERGWLRPIALPTADVRRLAPAVKIASDHDSALSRDAAALAARLPHDVFVAVRAGLAQGPVLIQSPRAGYLSGLVCQDCREAARCQHCGGPIRASGPLGGVREGLHCGWCARPLGSWTCLHCGGGRLRAPVVGATRTAEELGRAFPGAKVLQSGQGRILDNVGDEPTLVVATPGAEPHASGGYAAAVLLDAAALLNRADLRAAEEALRRWLTVVALVRPGVQGGTVIAVGPADSRALQALVRLDPAGFAARELDERRAAGFPPAVRFALIEGDPAAVFDVAAELRAVPGIATLGPVDLPPADRGPAKGEPVSRLMVRAALADGPAMTAALRTLLAQRTARKDSRALRARVDPSELS